MSPFILHPNEFVLGSTRERIRLPDDMVSRVEGKSSLGRLGLLIHSTAGFIDPAWDGHIRSEEHTSELQSLMRISYAVFCLKKKKMTKITTKHRSNKPK